MKRLFVAILFLFSTLSFAELTSLNGESCAIVASRVAREYLGVVETNKKLGFTVIESDRVRTVGFKNTTPGTYDQEFIATFILHFDRSQSNYRPEKDQKIKIKFTGEFNCDNLKVLDMYAAGGVERVD